LNSLKDQHVLILGLGISGLAMARWCARCGARVTVVDTRETPPGLAALRSELPNARFVCGALTASLIEGSDVRAVFRSPGLSPSSIEPVWSVAQAAGLWTAGELELFSAALKDLQESQTYQPQVIAITGTNGKTTVTALTGQLVERAGKSVAIAGNIGPSLLDTLIQKLDASALPEVWVLELSSFQLDMVKSFEPTAAVVLNLTQDHLDWHGDMAVYAEAKANVFGKTGLMLLNRDDAAVMAMLTAGQKGKSARATEMRESLSFGADMPQRPGDFGIETVNGMAWLVRAQEADETRRKRKSDEEQELFIQRLMPVDALRIRGRHNATNALAALALAQTAGCSLGPILYGLREYRGEPHRVESIGNVGLVEYFDDSKGTNVGASVAAISGLGEEASEAITLATRRKLVVILGGDGKGQSFEPLAASVSQHARAVVLIGRDGPLIRSALQNTGVPMFNADTMAQAVKLAAENAHDGDAVLMSPACASFDMFDNYEHRAQLFRAAVQELAQEAGTSLEVHA
jgi:UDP-N-acetylmuramoylalanine--D-glutamate ligase